MRIALSAAVASALYLATLTFASEAKANGRFPESNAIFFATASSDDGGTGDRDLVLLRSTFGLLVSRDRGKAWDWVCERSIGLAGVEDPMYSVTPDGTVIASSFQGLAISRDRSCNYGFAGGDLQGRVFIDLASRPATPGTVVAFASSYDGQDDAGLIYFKSTLFETKDEGKTFAPLGTGFDKTLLGETVDVTASDPDRLYVSAVRDPTGMQPSGVMLTSRDHGTTWEENPVALLPSERGAFIAAVDPRTADRVYVRTSGSADAASRLLVSDDAGKTFRTVFTAQGQLAGFALAQDGSNVWVGGLRDGVRRANTTDFVFTQTSKVEVSCLALGTDGLWACSNEKSGFVVGLSKDEGATFEAKLHFCDIRGPLACAVGSTTNTQCALGGTASGAAPPWPPQRAALGCNANPGEPEVKAVDAGTGGAAAAPEKLEAGGGCTVQVPSPSPMAALLATALAVTTLARRRKR